MYKCEKAHFEVSNVLEKEVNFHTKSLNLSRPKASGMKALLRHLKIHNATKVFFLLHFDCATSMTNRAKMSTYCFNVMRMLGTSSEDSMTITKLYTQANVHNVMSDLSSIPNE